MEHLKARIVGSAVVLVLLFGLFFGLDPGSGVAGVAVVAGIALWVKWAWSSAARRASSVDPP